MTSKNSLLAYILVSFGWTWLCWISAYFLGRSTQTPLRTEMTLFELVFDFSILQLIFSLGVFGPLLGFLIVRSYAGAALFRRPAPAIIWLAVWIPLAVGAPALLLSALFSDLADVAWHGAMLSIVSYFFANVMTSGTEEFGWRGFLYPYLRSRNKDFWGAAWKGGLIWAAWHYPLLFILYFDAGAAILFPSLLGFTASIVAMNYITNFVFERSGSILLAMALHALNNTVSFALISLFPGTPFTIVSALMAWAVVGYLEKKGTK